MSNLAIPPSIYGDATFTSINSGPINMNNNDLFNVIINI